MLCKNKRYGFIFAQATLFGQLVFGVVKHVNS